MKQSFEENVANDVATKRKKYVSPEIEVIDLDEQPRLLAGSTTHGARFRGVDRDNEEW